MKQLTTKEEQDAGGLILCRIYAPYDDGDIEMSFSFAGKTIKGLKYPSIEAAKSAAQKFAMPYGQQFQFGPTEWDMDFGGSTCIGSFMQPPVSDAARRHRQ